MKRRVLLLLAVFVLGAGAAGAYVRYGGRRDSVTYRTARVERGTITATVSVTGTLSAVTSVLVGSQLSGQVKELFVDFNSPVKKGQLLARIDPDIFDATARPGISQSNRCSRRLPGPFLEASRCGSYEPRRYQREPKASSNSESIAAQERRSAAAL